MFEILLINTLVYYMKNRENHYLLSNVLLAMVLTRRSKYLRLVIAEKLTRHQSRKHEVLQRSHQLPSP